MRGTARMGGKAVLTVLESLFWNQTFQQWFGHKAIPFRYGIINLELEYGSTPRLLRHFLHVAFLNVIVDRHGFNSHRWFAKVFEGRTKVCSVVRGGTDHCLLNSELLVDVVQQAGDVLASM